MRPLVLVLALLLGAGLASAAGGSYAYAYVTPLLAHHATEDGGDTWCNCYRALDVSGDVTFTMRDVTGVSELVWELRDVGTFDVCLSGGGSGVVTIRDVASPCSLAGAYPSVGTAGTIRYEWTG